MPIWINNFDCSLRAAVTETRIAILDDPRTLGAPLEGEHDGCWRWRIGDYRVVARIEDERITILVVRVRRQLHQNPLVMLSLIEW